MRFEKNVTWEKRKLLLEQLKEYELNTPMSNEERNELYDWVSKGRSPYENGNYICGEGGGLLDFISALRADRDLQDWFNSLSEEEKEAERNGSGYQYDTDMEENYFDMMVFQFSEVDECDLPFSNKQDDDRGSMG